jgi:hypothetical protein
VLGTIYYTFSQFFIFFNNNPHQNILTFFTFYITSIIFYYYSNKKFTKIQNFFTFLYKFFLLYITSSFLINFKINSPTTPFYTYLYQTTPKYAKWRRSNPSHGNVHNLSHQRERGIASKLKRELRRLGSSSGIRIPSNFLPEFDTIRAGCCE